jgi:hypothetical protein
MSQMMIQSFLKRTLNQMIQMMILMMRIHSQTHFHLPLLLMMIQIPFSF